MDTGRIYISLNQREARALLHMAEADCRHPREQMRFLLREEARKRGILPDSIDEQKEERNTQLVRT